MSEVANELTKASQASQLSADEASLLDGYDPNTGDPIAIPTARPDSYLTNVGDRPVVYTGDPTNQKDNATPQQVDSALKDLFANAAGAPAAVVKDVAQGALETPSAILNGMANAGNELLDGIDELGDTVTQALGGPAYVPGQGMTWQAPGQWDATEAAVQESGGSTDMAGGNRLIPGAAPDSNTGKFVEGVSQFMTGFVAGGKALKAVKLAGVGGAAVQAAAKGAISDLAFFDGQAANLSALVEGTPLANPVTEFLATNEDTPELEGRLKHAAEGLGLGVLTEGLIGGLKLIRKARKARPAGMAPVDPEEAVATASEAQYRSIIGDPDGDVFTTREGAKLAAAEADLTASAGVPRIGTAPERVGLNMARVNTPEDVAAVLTRTEDMNQDALARSVGYRSWAEADAAAGGMDGYRLLMERDSGRVFTDAEALAARKTDLAAWAAVREAATAHSAGPTPATAAAVREAWVKAFAIHKELLGARADAARALAVWRMTAEQGSAKAAYRAMDAAFSGGGRATADEISKRVLTLDIMADPEVAARFLEKSAMTRGRDMIAEAYQGSILSSPKTQVVNAFGNTANLLYSIMERGAAGKLAQAMGADDSIDLAEASAMGFGAREGFRDALRYTFKMLAVNAKIATGNALKRPDEIERALSEKASIKGELLKMTGRADEQFNPAITAENARGIIPMADKPIVSHAINGLGALTRVFGNAMAFQDDLFKLMNHRAELYAQAARQAGYEMRETEGITRLYRGEPPFDPGMVDSNVERGRYFTEDVEKARYYAGKRGTVYSIDIPTAQVDAIAPKGGGYNLVRERIVDAATAFQKVPLSEAPPIVTHDTMGQRIADLVNNPTDDILEAARKAAEERTFTAPPGEAAKLALKFRRLMNQGGIGLPLGTMIMPFVNTPANILGYTFRRTPLAPLFKKYRDAIAAGGAEADLANAQVAMGTMSLLLMSDYAISGQVTGAEPAEASQREIWRRSGIQPYSIKIGDKWVAYNRIEPIGTVMGIGADLAQLMTETPFESDDDRQEQIDEAWTASIGAIGSLALNKTYLTTLGGAVEYFADPVRNGDAFISSLVSPLVPNIVRDIERIKDPYLREASNIVDRLKARTPGVSEDLPLKFDLWGDPVSQVSDMGAVYDMFIPVPVRKQVPEAIDQELVRLHADVSYPSKTISVEGMDIGLRNRPDIYVDLVRTASQDVRLPKYYNMTMKEYLNALVAGKVPDSELYKERLDSRGATERDDDEKTDMIRSIMRDYRREASERIKEKYARDLHEMADRKRRTTTVEQQ